VGVIGEGAGVYNDGIAVITDSLIADNRSFSAGGVINSWRMRLVSSVVENNEGGGIRTGGNDLNVIDSEVRSNAGRGIGGGGRITIEQTTIADNVSSFGEGAGIFFIGEGAEGETVLAVDNSLITGNQAAFEGGGIYTWTAQRIAVSNSTISGNRAGILQNAFHESRDAGGGIFVQFGELDLSNVTITENSAMIGGGIFVSSHNQGVGDVRLANTIVGFNSPGEDCSGEIVSAGHNANVDGTCALDGPGDFPHAIIDLALLADNGGPTQTHALPRLDLRTDVFVQNDAIDGADPASCPNFDQRGEARPFDGDGDGAAVCDIGSFELREEPLTCEPGPCGVTAATPGPTPAPIATTAPIALPRTGGQTHPTSAIPLAIVAVALPAVAAAVFITRCVFNQR
jgi:hypothetical protein